eukprot:CAMPEP_0167742518 /NCGR_PEP_ID=MMETSP0110_2-20121227/1479_1 /TAXON_ID=629695 /ORGANISM="Gymnochlora sp., Strain CCMP2014" /LENGTH=495 /DNA_ID=CAMNT_0007626735 /DNA_START=304 /DNA_END=1788 /DNA_ORIENTATION=-
MRKPTEDFSHIPIPENLQSASTEEWTASGNERHPDFLHSLSSTKSTEDEELVIKNELANLESALSRGERLDDAMPKIDDYLSQMDRKRDKEKSDLSGKQSYWMQLEDEFQKMTTGTKSEANPEFKTKDFNDFDINGTQVKESTALESTQKQASRETNLDLQHLPKNSLEMRDEGYWDRLYRSRGAEDPIEFGMASTGELVNLLAGIIRVDEQVLIAGSGTSRLSERLYDTGVVKITNVDFSKPAVDSMKRAHQIMRHHMRWIKEDLYYLSSAHGQHANAYNVIIDKATLDSIVGGSHDLDGSTSAKMYLEEMRKCLRKGRSRERFVCITFGDGHISQLLLESFPREELWGIEIYRPSITQPSTSSYPSPQPSRSKNLLSELFRNQTLSPIRIPRPFIFVITKHYSSSTETAPRIKLNFNPEDAVNSREADPNLGQVISAIYRCETDGSTPLNEMFTEGWTLPMEPRSSDKKTYEILDEVSFDAATLEANNGNNNI